MKLLPAGIINNTAMSIFLVGAMEPVWASGAPDLLEMQVAGPCLELGIENLEWGLESCVFIGHPGDSDAH